tara:strand:- start:5189 stop:7576 length:2388 start_codon:yes stop_codon:yes gene_type:complete
MLRFYYSVLRASMSQDTISINATLAHQLRVNLTQVDAAVTLLDEGATVPFIARYRKEATQGLNDTQLRELADSLYYLREFNARREVILSALSAQNQLTDDLKQALFAAKTKARLEDLYLPFKLKRRTKATEAKEAGLEPLANQILQAPCASFEAKSFVNPAAGIDDEAQALKGAQHILIERFAENPDLLLQCRQAWWQQAKLHATSRAKDHKAAQAKYADYLKYSEMIKKIPSHRALALLRGRKEGVLRLTLDIDGQPQYGLECLARFFHLDLTTINPWLLDTLAQAWKTKLLPKLELELLTQLREKADEAAIKVFAKNLRDLLLTAPAGNKVILGLDPGIRTGIKAVVVDDTGKVLDYATVFPFSPQNARHEAIAELAKLIIRFNVELISIGNGTGSRETEKLVQDVAKMYPDLTITKMIVSEAGASVYSASALGAEEFPELDVSVRGAVSIARRLQDPLAELVKIEPKALGVGQYQHDVNQTRLARTLNGVVEDCVNWVGVDVNTASAVLLAQVAGLNATLAANIVAYRDEHGRFNSREALKDVPRMGEKSFEQAAGFLRVLEGHQLLDTSRIHPEAYPLVEKILAHTHLSLSELWGNHAILDQLDPEQFVTHQYGLPTVLDVITELKKPQCDPRAPFKMVRFKEGIENIADLKLGMILEGVVSNVTNFGAFIDIGVHQDGLVHVSEMTHRFVNDPHQFIKAQDVVQVRVIEVDVARKRIGLSLKLQEKPVEPVKAAPKSVPKPTTTTKPVVKKASKTPVHDRTQTTKVRAQPKKSVFNTSMADALAKLKRDL